VSKQHTVHVYTVLVDPGRLLMTPWRAYVHFHSIITGLPSTSLQML